MKYNQKLPSEVEKKLDEYIERIKSIQWFQVSPDIKREDVEKQVKIILEGFGVKASVEYRSLKSTEDWHAACGAARDAAWGAACGAARDAAWGAAWGAALHAALDAAWGAARGAAWGAAWGAARGAALDAALDAARGAARGAADVLALNIESYKTKYPNGNFVNLIPLWEAGLYPCGLIDGKFVVYVPTKENPMEQFFANDTEKIAEDNYAVVAGKKYKLIESNP